MWGLDHVQWACIRAVVNTSLYIRRSSWLSPETQPDRLTTYPCRPQFFASRIFIPRRHNSQQRLPLVIRAHGGGFIVNNPSADDPIARHLADHAHCCVVSIDYSKSPQAKFPVAFEDVIAQSLAVIEDQELPLDGRVVLCGSSAGGNLLLAAAQDARLRSKIVGVAGIYPPVDLVQDGRTKMDTRPDSSVPDFIGDSYAGIQRLYFDASQPPDLADPRVSPINFGTRDRLPQHVLLIGAEHDMFCHEDEAMADKLAGDGVKAKTEAGWRVPGAWWHKVYGQPHAFDGFPVKDAEKEKMRLAAVDEMYGVLTEWLGHVFTNVDTP